MRRMPVLISGRTLRDVPLISFSTPEVGVPVRGPQRLTALKSSSSQFYQDNFLPGRRFLAGAVASSESLPFQSCNVATLLANESRALPELSCDDHRSARARWRWFPQIHYHSG